MLAIRPPVTHSVYCPGLAASEWQASQWLYSSSTIWQFRALLRMILRFTGARELKFTPHPRSQSWNFHISSSPRKTHSTKIKGIPSMSSSLTPPTILNPCMVKNLFSCKTDLICLNKQGLCQGIKTICLSGLSSRVLIYEWTRWSEETPRLGLVHVTDHTWPCWMINTSLTSVPGTQLELNKYVNVKDRKQDLVVQHGNMLNQSRRYSIHLGWD